MAELDLYGDLYGDVDDVGSPVALSPSQQAAPHNDPASGMQAEQRANAPSPPAGVPDHPMNNPPASQPTTFSISTYEDPSYANKKHNPTGQSDSPHPPRPSVDTNSASHTGPGSKVWGVKPSDMPDEGKMFVGGLNWETTEDALKQYFAQFGNVVHCTIMRDPTNGRSRGFAFLTFADPTVVNKVMVKEHFLDGKLIDPKRAIPRGSGPGPSAIAGAPMADRRAAHHQFGAETPASLSNKLFCRGMPEDATPQSFRAFWAQYDSQANIEEAILMMDRDSNRHRGFGFVNLVTGDDAESLLRCGPFVMDGHPLEVKRKAPSRARFDGREDLAKMAPAPLDRYGVPYAGPAHHNPAPFHPAPMGGYFKPGMSGPSWKGWNPSMVQPMAGGPNRGLYMGMGIPHDDRGMGPARGMIHDVPGGMVGAYGGPYHRSASGGYGHDWRGGPPGMRAVGPGAYPPYHQHSNPPSSGGPSRNQRGPRNYAPY
ncbi:hypothetical protein PGT21_030608 [Puccinia graminis f. sp. tritici]|uniref:RRM domain-containing protein n=3 Tax=Puccinia graminis f. sp. tritici TaxID=56615 RepID=H6QVB5_PUCGT|nr:uncharacterized protein PGTG_22696 [Puccinia graminis f. sp. tritici CRL 75-36-700-3]EHS62844.1 hypothetical protein PGTG_22696 [Puccinia graminis f. sp. tritici CRL 75-36-700-3]KAA1109003.1 hypothetical protein PGT21_030608 [Puccinia graminis f. sp. tritici]KAA1122528.1 hypothetical protein PGTUg99_037744 [Puccinia graminis f. sp. tritici]